MAWGGEGWRGGCFAEVDVVGFRQSVSRVLESWPSYSLWSSCFLFQPRRPADVAVRERAGHNQAEKAHESRKMLR